MPMNRCVTLDKLIDLNDNDDSGTLVEKANDVDDDDIVQDDPEGVTTLRRCREAAHSTIRRNDTYANFLARCEHKHPDEPPTADQLSERRVTFKHDDALELVHLIASIPEDCKTACWLTDEDFARMENEVSLTMFRWESHVAGKLAFDESQNTIRGLESVMAAEHDAKRDGMQRWQHVQNVLTEMRTQKLDGCDIIDWTKLRSSSLQVSKQFVEKAQEIGELDEKAKHDAWKEKENDATASNAATTKTVASSSASSGRRKSNIQSRSGKTKKEKKKRLNALMFWKKSSKAPPKTKPSAFSGPRCL